MASPFLSQPAPECVCSHIKHCRATNAAFPTQLIADLNAFLDEVCSVASNSDLEQQIQFTIRQKRKTTGGPSSRTKEIFQTDFKRYENDRDALLNVVKEDRQAFWNIRQLGSEATQQALRNTIFGMYDLLLQTERESFHGTLIRRFSCVAVYLTTTIAGCIFSDQAVAQQCSHIGLHTNLTEEQLVNQFTGFRNGGRRYLNIALRLGGLGALWFLPLEASSSIYVLDLHL
jgi:hypothetical protein